MSPDDGERRLRSSGVNRHGKQRPHGEVESGDNVVSASASMNKKAPLWVPPAPLQYSADAYQAGDDMNVSGSQLPVTNLGVEREQKSPHSFPFEAPHSTGQLPRSEEGVVGPKTDSASGKYEMSSHPAQTALSDRLTTQGTVPQAGIVDERLASWRRQSSLRSGLMKLPPPAPTRQQQGDGKSSTVDQFRQQTLTRKKLFGGSRAASPPLYPKLAPTPSPLSLPARPQSNEMMVGAQMSRSFYPGPSKPKPPPPAPRSIAKADQSELPLTAGPTMRGSEDYDDSSSIDKLVPSGASHLWNQHQPQIGVKTDPNERPQVIRDKDSAPAHLGSEQMHGSSPLVPQAGVAMDHDASADRTFREAVLEEQERLERKFQEEREHELLAHQLQKQLDFEDRQEQRVQDGAAARKHSSHPNLAQQQLEQQHRLEDTSSRDTMKELAEREMKSTTTGKAWKLVERVHELHRTKTKVSNERPVSVDDMVFLAERMFEAQEEFRKRGLPCIVDLGYHYTSKANMKQIRTDGLLSKAEREAKNIVNKFNGEIYGPGIYTGNDARTFRKYGSVGLVVARLKGRVMDPITAGQQYARGNTSIAVGPLVVLEKSCQCLALLQFKRSSADDIVREYTAELYSIIDEFFNRGDCSTIPLSRSLAGRYRTGGVSKASKGSSSNISGAETNTAVVRSEPQHNRTTRVFRDPDEVLYITAPSSSDAQVAQGATIVPSFSMYVYTDPSYTCAGFSPGTIVIRYGIPAGIRQLDYESAGWEYNSTRRLAYLPDNETGRHLLRRLQFAFKHGLTFKIRTVSSPTGGQTDSVVWASIPHKTALQGGSPNGFPDPTFFAVCNSELNSLGVPRYCSANQM